MADKPENNSSQNWIRGFAIFSTVVTDLVVCIGIGFGLGWLAWKKLGAPGWIIIPTSMAGLALAFIHIYLVSQRIGPK